MQNIVTYGVIILTISIVVYKIIKNFVKKTDSSDCSSGCNGCGHSKGCQIKDLQVHKARK